MYENDTEKVEKFLKENEYFRKAETNAVIKKFFEMPLDERQKLFYQLKDSDEKSISTAFNKLLALLLESHKELPGSTPPIDGPQRTFYIWQYFRLRLKRPTKEKFEIPLIE